MADLTVSMHIVVRDGKLRGEASYVRSGHEARIMRTECFDNRGVHLDLDADGRSVGLEMLNRASPDTLRVVREFARLRSDHSVILAMLDASQECWRALEAWEDANG